MTLTLVQLATAIEQGKTLETAYPGGLWTPNSDTRYLMDAFLRDSSCVRIKPEPRRFWLDTNSGNYVEMITKNESPCVEYDSDKINPAHCIIVVELVKEVLQ